MRKNLVYFVVVLAVIGLGVSVFTVFFEVVEDEKYFLPSGEALTNDYLALDRWLKAEGYTIRVETQGDLESLKTASEGTILIQQDLFDWNRETAAYLESWVEKGGVLILCLDYYRNWDGSEEPGAFLNRLGLKPEEDYENTELGFNSNSPSYGRNIFFEEPKESGVLSFKDENGSTRLVEFPRGRGKIFVTGRPRFMNSFLLDAEANARLSWYLLSGAGDEIKRKDGILFIRGERKAEGAVGRIFREGNFTIIVISALALIAAGFWSTIPVFGLVRGDEKKRGKALAERFLAEGRFLKRFGALDVYRTAYFREIRRRLLKAENLTEEEVIPRAASVWASDPARISDAEKALSPARQNKRDFLKSIVILKTILERL